MLANLAILNPMVQAGVPAPLAALGLSGVVYGVLGNDPALVAALGDAVHQPPYKAPPRAPVLFLKPRNTLAASGSCARLPGGDAAFEIGASLGLVIGRTACRVHEGAALDYLAGYVAVADLSVPHASFYRPSLRMKARDGSCLIGPALTPAGAIPDPDNLAVRVRIDGQPAHTASTAGRTRGVARLLAEVTQFMTLRPGDVLMLGASHGAPHARAGQKFEVDIKGLPTLQGEVTTQEAQA